MKITELINQLTQLKKQLGNREVILSSDPEGNNYWTIDDSEFTFGDIDGYLAIYPSEVKDLD